MKNFPQYKYVSRPLYKKLRENQVPPLVAVPATFLTMDFLFHQMPSNLFVSLMTKKMRFHYIKLTGLFFFAASIPVAINKQFIDPAIEKDRQKFKK